MPENRPGDSPAPKPPQEPVNTPAARVFSERMSWRRPALALFVSLAVHVALFFWLRTRPVPPPAPARSTAVEMELVQVDAPPGEERGDAVPPPARSEGPKAPKEPRAPPQRQAAKQKATAAPPASGKSAAPSTGDAAGAGSDSPLASDTPSTSPSGSWVLGLPTLKGPDGRTSRANPGRTIKPGDVTGESLDAEGERVRGRVQGLAEGQLADLRVQDGLIHPYFTQLRRALQSTAKDAPPFKARSPNVVQSYLRDWAAGASAYGKTGSPVPAAPPTRGRPQEGVNPTLLAQQQSGFVDPTATMAAQSGALRGMAEGGPVPELVAIVDLFQGPDGAFRRVELIESSGVPEFDKHVLGSAKKALAGMTPPPREASAKIAKGEELRTTWAFEGRVVYMRHVKDMNSAGDALYLAAALPASLLTGKFEETTGDIQVVDIRKPSYQCTVRLLRVY